MKKINYLLFMLVAVATVLFTACNSDEYEAPQATPNTRVVGGVPAKGTPVQFADINTQFMTFDEKGTTTHDKAVRIDSYGEFCQIFEDRSQSFKGFDFNRYTIIVRTVISGNVIPKLTKEFYMYNSTNYSFDITLHFYSTASPAVDKRIVMIYTSKLPSNIIINSTVNKVTIPTLPIKPVSDIE